nr:uncharacterized protein LOC128703242 [Cherax quadricarinatus]
MLSGMYVMLTLVVVVTGKLDPPERPYKILVLTPVSSQSHKNVFMPLARALADRGHQVTILSNNTKLSEYPNITEVPHGLIPAEPLDAFMYRKDWTGGWTMFEVILPNFAQNLYKIPAVKELYERRKEFDLFLVDHAFNEVRSSMYYSRVRMSHNEVRSSMYYSRVRMSHNESYSCLV